MALNFSRNQIINIVGISISAVALSMYLLTLSPTLNFIDSGELATDAYTLGIAHPTGYPLFTLAGYLFSHIPLGLRIITQVNVFAAILCATGLFFFFKFLIVVLRAVGSSKKKTGRGAALSKHEVLTEIIPAAGGTLVLAFSETYWSQALSIEVYPLHILFLSLILYLFVSATLADLESDIDMDTTSRRRKRGYWFMFAYVLGLAFTNHMTTILLAPAFFYLYFSVHGFGPSSWRRIVHMTPVFLLGLSAYLYLPVRASDTPLMNWGDPSSLERMLWHIGGKVYRVWFFTSTESAEKQLNYFVNSLPAEFAIVPLILAALGLWMILKSNRRFGIFSILLFIGCVGYSINYDIHDIDSYFLLAYFSIAFWAGAGLKWLAETFGERLGVNVFASVLAAFIIILIMFEKPRVDQHNNYLVEDYTNQMLQSLDPNAIIISYQWDYLVSAAYYLQIVEHVRPDVTVIDKELLRRSWYIRQLEHRYPWLIEQSRVEVNAFLKELYKFEHDLPYSGAVIEDRYRALILSFLARNMAARSEYVTAEIEPEYTAGFVRVPSGLAFRVTKDPARIEVHPPAFSIREFPVENTYVDGILSMYARAYCASAQYFLATGDKSVGSELLERALQVRPDFREAIAIKEKFLVPTN